MTQYIEIVDVSLLSSALVKEAEIRLIDDECTTSLFLFPFAGLHKWLRVESCMHLCYRSIK
jgi:hypothetical protein